MTALNLKAGTIYYLALLDWGKILPTTDLEAFTEKIIPNSKPPADSWATCDLKDLKWVDLQDVYSATLGYYHSRLIFTFRFSKLPENILGVRKLRIDLENRIVEFLNAKVIPQMDTYVKDPRIFIYPIVEIRGKQAFWSFSEEKPYSFPTTCFYTELQDPRRGKLGWLFDSVKPKKVKMRVSGAKVITSEMSNWFFWNLTNMIFHEGLYRQSRDKDLPRGVYPGLEKRLEDFAANLMTNFYELSNARVQGLIARVVLVLTIVGVLVAIAQFVVPLFPHSQTPLQPSDNSTALNKTIVNFLLLPS